MISEQVTLFAPAKVNLTLHVTGQRADGYHLLDSLVAFADVGDRIGLSEASEMSLEVTGPFATGVPADARNSVWQAALRGVTPYAISLEKNLPNGAGIGGGSADAAAILRHLGKGEAAANLGADVPVCLLSRAQRMRGIGEVLEPVQGLPPLYAVLANPGVSIATPVIFQALVEKDNPPMPEALPRFADAAALIEWLQDTRNDLEVPALKELPVVGEVLAALRELGPLARMSGSGATCFGLFGTRTEAERAAKALAAAHPGWWVVPCALS
ncbi:MAG: 4-(cytidine 5'-diphospho)-2-C-methyl-D-erythritol kinase [Sulfitobacter sp.]|nr:4-(cytidine 5'-diphospho)-2-C-methyl-D-erythritol kinase [Sulfitobacter sp.]